MDGISPKKAKALKNFECPGCGASVSIRAVGFSVSAVCPSCKSIIDVHNDLFRIIERAFAQKSKWETVIPLGSRGKIKDVQWECIGMVVRCDQSEAYYWKEYLLFNPYHGFRWLVENEGHWNFVTMIKERPQAFPAGMKKNVSSLALSKSIDFREKTFKLFLRGEAKVKYVTGEFYWKVKLNDTTQVGDYIAPPLMLSMEGTKGDIVWSLAEYIEANQIRDAFGVKSDFPSPYGIGPNQPHSASTDFPKVSAYFFSFFLIISALQFVHILRFQGQTLARESFTYNAADINKTRTSNGFTIPPAAKNVYLSLDAPINNLWFEVKGEFVDEKDGKSADDFEMGVEKYSGYDDGYWSEGSQSASIPISELDPGNYHLKIEAQAPTNFAPYITPVSQVVYTMGVNINVPNFSNYFIALGLLLIGPFFAFFKKNSVEVSRWSNSDFPIGGD